MKKVYIIISIILVLFMTGCNNTKNNNINTINPTQNDSESNTNIFISKINPEKDWVYDADYEKNVTAESYTTKFEETYYAKEIVVPYININSSDAKFINSEIESIFDYLIEEYNNGTNDLTAYIDTCEYKYNIYNNVLSGIFTYSVGATDVPIMQYYTFCIDLSTGKELTYKNTYSLLGFNDSNIDVIAKYAITKKISEMNSDNIDTEKYAPISINNYLNSVNEDDIKFFIDKEGKLNVIVTLSVPAGSGKMNSIITLENDAQATSIDFLNNIYGVYGESQYDCISVFPGKDDEHINVELMRYRADGFTINDIKIADKGDGLIEGYKSISNEDDEFIDIDTKPIELNLSIKDNTIQLDFNCNVLRFTLEDGNTSLNYKKDNLKVITEIQKQRALDIVKDSKGQIINRDVFEIVKDTPNYLVLRVKCYILDNEHQYGYYNIEGSESVGMFKYYNFNKKNNTFITLNDLTNNSFVKLNQYINNAIDDKKLEWENAKDSASEDDGYNSWPYHDFKGINSIDYFENYFLVDEENKVVKIRSLSYPDEASRALGDICIDVPFNVFENI